MRNIFPAVMASALYFGAQTLFTGFVTPLTGASPLIASAAVAVVAYRRFLRNI